MADYSLKEINMSGLMGMETTNKLMSTDYPIGIGLIALGVTCIGVIIKWKYKSSNKKRRQ